MDLVQKLISRFPVISGVTLIVVVAMVVALILRLAGADFCLPMEHCHPDEHWLVTPTIKMMRTADFNPHYFVYPTLYMYVLLLVFCLTFVVGTSAGLWGGIGGIKTAPFLLAGRLTTGLLGTATVWGVYVAGKRLVDRPTGAVAALVLALTPLHVANSHFITTDVPAAFFCIMALCAAAAVANEGTKRHYILLGLMVGFAGAAKYNAAIVLLNIPLAHWLNPRRQGYFNGNLVRALLWVALGFLIACPYALWDMPRFLDGVSHEIAHYRRGHMGHQGDFNRTYYLMFLSTRGFGPVLTGLGIYGLWSMLRNFRREYLLLLTFPVLYLLFLGGYKVRFVRNLMPILPYLSLWIGVGVVCAWRDIRRTWPALQRVGAWKLAAPALALVLAIPGSIAIDETIALATTDTRLQARTWIEKNIPRGSVIYLQSWSVDKLPPRMYRRSRNRWSWEYYVGTDRLTRKYFNMKTWAREKYEEVREAYQHIPVAAFGGREENPYYCTANPSVVIFTGHPMRKMVRAP